MSWPVEIIPDDDSLFYRVHKNKVRSGLGANIFSAVGDGMSVDWSRYSDPTASRLRAKVPADNGIVELGVGAVRSLSQRLRDRQLHVTHDPLDENRSHGLIRPIACRIEDVEIRDGLFEIVAAKWTISPANPV